MKDEVKLILEEAGWYPGRRIEIGYMIEDFKREEITIPNVLIENLLKEFWNLELNFKVPNGMYGSVRLNTEEALGLEKYILNSYENLINEKLVPVGTINFDTGLLLVSYSGKFYMMGGGNFFLLGNNFFEALESIIYQKNIFLIA